MQFTACLENFNTSLWSYHIKVPLEFAEPFLEGKERRVVCALNETLDFQCALMPDGKGAFFILLNKTIRDRLKLKPGIPIAVHLQKDESKYGLPMPEEMEAVLESDPEANELFHALTPGKQRTLLYITGNAKSSDLRLRRAIVLTEHLKMMKGKIDFKRLNDALKEK